MPLPRGFSLDQYDKYNQEVFNVPQTHNSCPNAAGWKWLLLLMLDAALMLGFKSMNCLANPIYPKDIVEPVNIDIKKSLSQKCAYRMQLFWCSSKICCSNIV